MANGQHKRPPAPLIAVVVLAIAGGLGWWWYSTQGAGAQPDTLAGTIEASEYQVASTLAGRITSMTVAEGDSVTAGQVIAQLDDAPLKLQVESAQQGVKAAAAQLKQAKDDGTDAEIAAAKARLAQAEAAVKLARVQLGYATIKAPHDGVIVAVAANAGENAGPGKTLATIADPTDLFVRVFVPEPRLGEVAVGQAARVTYDGTGFTGTISFVSAEAEFTPNSVETPEQRGNLVYEVRVKVTEPDPAVLKAGLPVDVELGKSGESGS